MSLVVAMSDDEYEIPLRDQRYFGAGLKRQRVHFVSSTTPDTETPLGSAQTSAANKYLAIVLGEHQGQLHQEGSLLDANLIDDGTGADDIPSSALCGVCHKPLTNDTCNVDHTSSIVHQICLEHAYPPSHLDRDRKGLAVLQSKGWNPDSRQGLGKLEEGRLYPVKANPNQHRAGIGAKFEQTRPIVKPVKLDARSVRKVEKDARLQRQKLQSAFYQSEELDRYLADGIGE